MNTRATSAPKSHGISPIGESEVGGRIGVEPRNQQFQTGHGHDHGDHNVEQRFADELNDEAAPCRAHHLADSNLDRALGRTRRHQGDVVDGGDQDDQSAGRSQRKQGFLVRSGGQCAESGRTQVDITQRNDDEFESRRREMQRRLRSNGMSFQKRCQVGP